MPFLTMKIQENFLPEKTFKSLQSYCNTNDFRFVDIGNKLISVLETPKEIVDQLQEDGHELILSFIREAYDGFDNSPRIHADGIINNQKCDLAKVLYISNSNYVTPNGTAFWSHQKYGYQLPEDISNQEFDRLLTEDSNNLNVWKQIDFVEAKQNRLLTYNASHFHSKVPFNIDRGKRIVLVAFYTKK